MKTSDTIFEVSRRGQLEAWLRLILDDRDFTLTDLAADAGARRYFRIKPSGEDSLVVMDAPVAHNDNQQFAFVANLLASHGLHVPKVSHANLKDGFLLLSDLGDETYLKVLNNENADKLFDDATTALIKLQSITELDLLSRYNAGLMSEELALFDNWYIQQHLNITLEENAQSSLNNVLKLITERCMSQPTVLTHRDYMPRNLMVCEENPGILDFQDARIGPISYDVISLFKDAFISWEEEQVLDWTIRYWEKARKASLPVPEDFGSFYEDVEWMGLQRHLKVLGIFSRLKHRDGKNHYILDAPRFLTYARNVAMRYNALKPLLLILDQIEGKTRQFGHTF
ncbi:MAG TPA: aminoglycoside phosphotransferase [Betaproteobacteria bacterium]|jgi:N-acetylmuramate 1-kinase|nr:aminoglycoside phosphotransferase [Betaproteobacteria bacterium]